MIRSYRINKKYIFLLLNGNGMRLNISSTGNDNGFRKGTGSGLVVKFSHNRTASSLQLLMKYEIFVNDKRSKYQVQLLLLKFCECFFHGIPQMIIQLYVYIIHKDNVYDNQLNLILFYLSMITSSMTILQFIYECIFNTNRTHLSEIFCCFDPES